MVNQKVSEPVQDAVKAYLELAFGLTEASKKKAEKTVKKVAKELLGKGNATASQLQGMAEELVSTSVANREAVSRLVRVEMDRALSRVGLATSDDVATLTSRIEALERQLRDAKAGAGAKATASALAEPAVDSVAKAASGRKAAANAAPAKKTVAKKTVAKKAVAKKAPAEAIAEVAAASDVPAAAKKAPAKKAVKKATP